jgi:hypothetical protein
MSRCADSDRGPTPYHGVALPAELQRHTKNFKFKINFMWVGRDSNPRSPEAPDLQSGAFDRSATYPFENFEF